MPRIPDAALKKIQITGPLWSAEVDIIRLAEAQDAAFRTLFLDQTPRPFLQQDEIFLPGTLLLLCHVRRVVVQPGGDRYEWVRSQSQKPPTDLSPAALKSHLGQGQLSLLVVQAEADAWPTSNQNRSNRGRATLLPPLACVAGEISLTVLSPQAKAAERLYQALPIDRAAAAFADRHAPVETPQPERLLGEITVHSSGLSLYGQTRFPWQPPDDDPVQAPFWLSQDVDSRPDETLNPGAFRLRPEKERLLPPEAARWRAVWNQLSRDLNPDHPQNRQVASTVSAVGSRPQWMTLEITTPGEVPDLFWLTQTWGDPAQLQFAPDEFSLIVSDRPPYDGQNPPTSIARIAPSRVAITAASDSSPTRQLQLTLEAAKATAAQTQAGQLSYRYQAASAEEVLTTTDLKTAFSPVAVPRFIRNTTGQPDPEWTRSEDAPTEPVTPPVVWGFMPLENGWAQLPVPNLTEQIYLDSELENPIPSTTGSMLQGAIALGNEAVLSDYPAEQPWNLTWVDGEQLTGTWNLSATDGGFTLSQIDLTITNPVVTLNGFFWLSTGQPRIEDALPDLDNWVNGLESFPLKTAQPDRDLFPSPVLLTVEDLSFSARDANSPEPSAQLGNWRIRYAVDDRTVGWENDASNPEPPTSTVFDRLLQQSVLPAQTFSDQRPFIWQRHDRLPMVQALPLTQSQTPPNYPSASRQLVPFELGVTTSNLPQQWIFAATGAAAWLRLSQKDQPAPAIEWREQFDLPLVSLSLPGLLLDPLADGQSLELTADPLGLTPNYRFDLPYTDEINAFAQLPTPEVDPEAVSPLPDSPQPEAPQPLTRETFSDHWQTLSELASLASADGVNAWGHLRVYQVGSPEAFLFGVDVTALGDLLTNGAMSVPLQRVFANQGIALSTDAVLQPAGEDWTLTDGDRRYRLRLGRGIQHLVEPFDWPVVPDFQLTDYPGTLALQNGSAVSLTGDAALAGISGQFVETSGQLSRQSDPTPNAYQVTAGSMTAQLETDGWRDQRGLVRGWPLTQDRWLQTPVQFQKDPQLTVPYALTTAREVLPLFVGESVWQLWFRDLPLQLDAVENPQTGQFHRADRLSALTQDVNDPAGRGRDRNFLSGYEWRLGDGFVEDADEKQTDFLNLFGLHFYPLTLETLTLENGEPQRLEVIGRLQLPIAEERALTEFSNAVRLTYSAETDNDNVLTLTAIELVSPQGEWPLALTAGEASDAPLLVWQGVQLTPDRNGVVLQDPRLKFVLFDQIWAVPLTELHPTEANNTVDWTFTTADTAQTRTYTVPAEAASYIRPDRLSLTLDSATRQHQAHLELQVQLGTPDLGSALPAALAQTDTRVTFAARVQFPLLTREPEPTTPRWLSANLFEVLALDPSPENASTLVTSNQALQFQWQQAPAADLQLLPGIKLKTAAGQPMAETPGFAAITFELIPVADGIPQLRLSSAFLETLLNCQWGAFLQTDAPTQNILTPDGEAAPTGQSGQVEQVFGASAGDLVCAYTTTWQANNNTWSETLMLNGMLEIKNLISWPQALTIDTTDAMAQLQLPRLPVGQQTLPHLRHSLRILLNQHRLPTDLLRVGQGNLLFQLRPDTLWHFLAVVEHQLMAVDVGVSDDPTEPLLTLRKDRRWSVTQEVRWVTPEKFKTSLEDWTAHRSLDPVDGLAQTGAGYFNPDLNAALLAELDERLTEPIMFVEASTQQWLNQEPLSTVSPATLQFLPNGSQLGIIGSPDSYGPSDPAQPQWLLLTMPFLGRLQASVPELPDASPLQIDPITHLANSETASPLALMLATWQPGGSTPNSESNEPNSEPITVSFPVSSLDTATGRSLARLDQRSLEESWFRLQHPVTEPEPTQFQSVMATLQDSLARLSRSQALSQGFAALRPTVPPSTSETSPLADAITELLWQPQGLIKTEDLPPLGLQALYEFNEGTGDVVADVSGVGKPLDLKLFQGPRVGSGEYWQWEADGLRILRPAVLMSRRPAKKIVQACQRTGALTIEAWIEPTYDEDYPHNQKRFPIVSMARSFRTNFSLGQGHRNVDETPNFYAVRLRTDKTNLKGDEYKKQAGLSGSPLLHTDSGSLTRQLSHVVYTRSSGGEARFYLDGELIEAKTVPGDFSTWEDDLSLVLANQVERRRVDENFRKDGGRPWFGKYYRVAIYSQVLSARQVAQHFAQGFNGELRTAPHPWVNTGVQLATSQLLQDPAPSLQRYAAATLLPGTSGHSLSQSFALSPYLGLAFQPAGAAYQRQLVSAELLCLDAATGALRPIASYLWEDLPDAVTLADRVIASWARKIHLRLCPESPLAVLRLREIRRLSDAAAENTAVAPAITTYHYGIVSDLQAAEIPLKRMFRLRSHIPHLRFQEGQFGGCQLPPLEGSKALKLFELAPPQTAGAQPLYLTESPNRDQTWPWGLSALRVSLHQNTWRLTGEGWQRAGVVGPVSDSAQARTLWWQAAQSSVQYRSSTASVRPAAGLPAQFRAPAMASLLPVALRPPLPEIDGSDLFQQSEPVDRWQATLPATMRYLMVGHRPGVFFNLRHPLLRQGDLSPTGFSSGSVFVSGSLPVQHRMPRPVPLPENQAPERALQPWASYFEPSQNSLTTAAPADEAFWGADAVSPAKRLRLQLLTPERGAIVPDWDGQLRFYCSSDLASVSERLTVDAWTVSIQLVYKGTVIAYLLSGLVEPNTQAAVQTYRPADAEALKTLLERLAAGETLMVQANIKLTAATDNFSQTLSFPLRMTDQTALPLPLQPQFIQFEDPEYNRQLASPTAHVALQVQVPNPDASKPPQLVGVKLATDRREYNPDSLLSLRYDWVIAAAATEFEQISLTLKRIRAGIESVLTIPSLAERLSQLPAAELTQFVLSDLVRSQRSEPVLQADDTLQLTLSFYRTTPTDASVDPDYTLVLPVTIVAEPVQPSPEAAYALLRQNADGSVECVRFAWGALPSRVDMINASDLRSEIVRRRAVFQWTDTQRPGQVTTYAIQKITQTGSTNPAVLI
ncbi:MAG: LamG-like jellyroll fold domain-containing protein [Cyanobacteria bacterium J06629_9]